VAGHQYSGFPGAVGSTQPQEGIIQSFRMFDVMIKIEPLELSGVSLRKARQELWLE